MRRIRLASFLILGCALALAAFIVSDTAAHGVAASKCAYASRSCSSSCSPCPPCPACPEGRAADADQPGDHHPNPAIVPQALVY